MKALYFLSILIFCLKPLSAKTFEVLLRDDQFRPTKEFVELNDLESEDSFDGKYFKIVLSKSNEAIKFDDEYSFKAATVYYHLTKARNYFIERIKSEHVKKLEKITVRLEISHVFNEVGHFAHDNLAKEYNNALSVPSGKGFPAKNVAPWGPEIWFRPSLEVHVRDLGFSDSNDQLIKSSLHDFRNQTHLSNFRNFLFQLIFSVNAGQTEYFLNSVFRLVQSSVIMEFLYQTSDEAAQFFSRKIYKLDSAMVPEIIYHEYSHIALSDKMELTHSSPVNEGFADYFASKIAHSKELATHINEYNLFSGKKVKNKLMYRAEFERQKLANTDFVFGLLWSLGNDLKKDADDDFVFGMTRELNSSSNIRDDLIRSSLKSCTQFCLDPMNDRLKLFQFYHRKNF